MMRRLLALAAVATILGGGVARAAVLREGVSIRIEDPNDAVSSDVRGGPLTPVGVGDGVLFRLLAPGAREVSVVGEFNDWDPDADSLQAKRNGLWRVTVPIDDGEWAYLFVVDGEWIRDPDNPVLQPIPASVASVGDASLIRVRRGDVVVPRPSTYREAELGLDGAYDRANQVTLRGKIRYENRAMLHPDLTLAGGYAWGRERWLYDAGFVQPILGERTLSIGASVYRINATADEQRIGSTENTLAALFFREDWRDHFEAEGVSARLALEPTPGVEFAVRWRDEEHRSVPKTTDWGLFGGEKRMRANAPIDDGTLRGVALEGSVDTRNCRENPTRGVWLRGSYGWTGSELGGDYEFRKGIVDLRRYVKLSRGHHFDARLVGGTLDKARRRAEDGPLLGYHAVPLQERFYLGGIGTMRATQFKSIEGDRMVLLNAEFRVDVFDDLQAAVFADVGDAWIEETEVADLHTDVGIGLQDSDSSVRINVAKKLDRESGEGVFVSARIQRMF